MFARFTYDFFVTCTVFEKLFYYRNNIMRLFLFFFFESLWHNFTPSFAYCYELLIMQRTVLIIIQIYKIHIFLVFFGACCMTCMLACLQQRVDSKLLPSLTYIKIEIQLFEIINK